ncbi:MAG: alpha/beta fold hydrolase [Candidatus Pedobacter colombiensis]|uniref:Proline iminopeptidase n=1 Tax=Candidatus Pedobacter colombiensis TaxID=3121371 RepID=A0AAJ5W6Z0_9SPHI|nr:alpha/beta fold hydrolase [Pedobacter sp.]WEK18268.1 MAG: alpha/beta fold hydrolase [Pedobacter sp.]
MKVYSLIRIYLTLALGLVLQIFGQPAFSQKYSVLIEPCPKLVKADPRLTLKTGYLVVPENRGKPQGRKIKLPFFFVRRPDQDARKNVSIYITGGPGYSTTAGIDSISYNSGFLRYGGFIAFDQRGTKRAIPNLDADEVYDAIKQSYLEDKNKDSLVMLAVKKSRENLISQGIDLSAYNTAESVEDINDLRLKLGLDSLNLVGISYSGGLMLSMAQQHPEGVRTLVLNSPLPSFVTYEESALNNINEALEQVFSNCAADSGSVYKDLKIRFHNYFTDLGTKRFQVRYLEKNGADSTIIHYGKQELLDAIVNRLNTAQVKTVPLVISEILSGRAEPYVREVLDGHFAGNPSVSLAMRYSVYCSGQIAFANPKVQKQEETRFPWLAGYVFNNVDHLVCDCWQVRPVRKAIRKKIYSTVPALITAGDADPWCRPYYNRLIKSGMPNAQLLILHDKGHGPGYVFGGVNYLDEFMKAPMQRLKPIASGVTVE